MISAGLFYNREYLIKECYLACCLNFQFTNQFLPKLIVSNP